jgi:hypothetical protein
MFCPKCGTQNPDNGKFCRNCGMDLAVISTEPKGLQIKQSDYYIDRKGRVRSNDPDEIWSSGLRNTISGFGFLVVSMALLLTNVAGGHAWWWAMLFPAFSLLASGIGNIAKSKRLEKRRASGEFQTNSAPLFNQSMPNQSLPPQQTEYISSEQSRYKTGDLVPPSVTDNTTRHLEINKEGDTMTLPQKK